MEQHVDPSDVGAGRPRRVGRSRTFVLVAAAFVAGSMISGVTAAVAVSNFTDVPNGHQFKSEIDWMVDHGISDGYADNTFRPTNPVSRQAFASFLSRYNAGIELRDYILDPSSDTAFNVETICAPGKRAVGGGGSTSAAGLVMTDSSPSGADRWAVRWESKSGASVDPTEIHVYALCVPEV